MNFSRRFLGPSVECYRLSLEFETPPQEIVIDVAVNGGSSTGTAGESAAASSASPSKPIAAAAKPSPSGPTLACAAASPPRQGPQTLQSIEDQWRKRASADHRNYTSVVVEWSSNESAAAVGARAAAAVAVDESGGGRGAGAPTVERVSLAFVPRPDGGVSARLAVSRVRARLAMLEFSRGGGGGAGAPAAAAAAAPASDAAASAAAANEPPEHSHPVAAILAALPLGGVRRVRCCEGTVLEALEALLPAEVEVEPVAEEEKEGEGGGGGGEAPATEEARPPPPSLLPPPPSLLLRSPHHAPLRIRSLFLSRCGKILCFEFSTERERESERRLLQKKRNKKTDTKKNI